MWGATIHQKDISKYQWQNVANVGPALLVNRTIVLTVEREWTVRVMSVLIKGEQMPKYCGECDGCRFDDLNVENRCFATGEFLDAFDIYKERGKYCPLVEIPPHGRLIDADKVVRYMEERQERLNDDKALWELSVVDTFLSDAPTVIESEEDNA